MLNSAATSRRQILRMLAFQAGITVLMALACFAIDSRAALAALIGGGAMSLGSALSAWISFGHGVIGAGEVLGRMLLGMAVKWLVVISGLYLVMAVWKLPAWPALVAVALAAVAILMTSKQGVMARKNA
ncbi:MAG: ATP synthase subunit I [Xanthomonadales bacterium]|nr:ATP synthase subunit I [Xanthomonadales bacterium]